MKKVNNKGMTLVEIIIVLVIASLTMVITGGILVNSLGYFDTSTKTSLDKQATDGIMDYISDEIKYATDVRVSNTVPDERSWHKLSVSNGRLYRDDHEVFNDDYYVNKRKLVITVRGFKVNGYRLDMEVSFKKSNNDDAYKTKKTFELINFNMNDDISNSSTNYFSNISTNTQLNGTNYLYYIIDDSNIKTDDSGDDKGDGTITVADQIDCINTNNNRGQYVDKRIYRKGDFVYCDGYWWQLVMDESSGTSPTGTARWWKKIDKNYSSYSAYSVNDIVFYKGYYYICIKDLNNKAASPSNDGYAPDGWNGMHGDGDNKPYWKYIGPENTMTKEEVNHNCESWSNNREKTVMNKLDNLSDQEKKNIKEYDVTKTYVTGDWVYIEQSGVKQYYLKVISGNGARPGTSAKSGWQVISRDWNVNSTYIDGDVVYIFQGNKFVVTFNKTINFNFDILSKCSYNGYTYDLWNTNNNLYYSVKQI